MKKVDFSKLGRDHVACLRSVGELAGRRGVRAWIVGGVVRDLLLHRPSVDIDIVIEGDGIVFAKALAEAMKAGVVVYPKFGTATLTLKNGMALDVVTARKESYARPGALPDVRPGSLADDLYRRDFTINALAASIMPDNFGALRDDHDGLVDLQKSIVRILHDQSFVDDPTRILRAARYEQRFGFRMSRSTLAALKQAVATDSLKNISGVRYWNELRRTLEEDDPVRSLQRLNALGAMRFVSLDTRSVLLIRGVVRAGKVCDFAKGQAAGSLWRVHCAVLLSTLSPTEVSALLTQWNVAKSDKQKILELLQIMRLPAMLDRHSGPEKSKITCFETIILTAAIAGRRC